MRDDLLRWHRVASCGWIAWQCEVRGVREDTSPHYAEAGVRLDLEQEDGAEVRREEGASLMPHPPLAWPRPRSLWVEASAGPCVRPGTPPPDPLLSAASVTTATSSTSSPVTSQLRWGQNLTLHSVEVRADIGELLLWGSKIIDNIPIRRLTFLAAKAAPISRNVR